MVLNPPCWSSNNDGKEKEYPSIVTKKQIAIKPGITLPGSINEAIIKPSIPKPNSQKPIICNTDRRPSLFLKTFLFMLKNFLLIRKILSAYSLIPFSAAGLRNFFRIINFKKSFCIVNGVFPVSFQCFHGRH